MKALIVQLSDIHIKGEHDPILDRAPQIAAALTEFATLSDIVVCLVSGDISFSGKQSEYALAKRFLEDIRNTVGKQTAAPIHFVVAPGNHDCDFSGDLSLRTSTIDGLLVAPPATVTAPVIACCTSVQSCYWDFCGEIESHANRVFSDKLFSTHLFNVGEYSIAIDTYNVSWLSKKREQTGRLFFPCGNYESYAQSDASIRLGVFHHPFNWYAPGENREFFTHIRRYSDIAFTGHEHTCAASRVQDLFGDIKDTEFIEGTALQLEDDATYSGFNAVLIDFDAQNHLVVHYRRELPDGGQPVYIRYDTEESWEQLPIATRSINEFQISRVFYADLEDSGALFSHSRKESLSLSDFYVYPDVRFVSTDDIAAERVTAKIFDSINVDDKYSLIRGEEKSGKTSLLYRLYIALHAKGCVPIYIDASEITHSSDLEMRKMISKIVNQQYGPGKDVQFFQLPLERRVLLLDNMEQVPINEKYRQHVVQYVKREFGRLIFTSNDLIQIEEFFTDSAAVLDDFRQCDLQRFGHRLRFELINKWNSIGMEETLAEGERLARNDRARQVLDAVIGKHFVPSLPIFLMAVLQSLDANNQTEIRQSGFGHYYHYLIVMALRQTKVKEQDLPELFNYLEHLAFSLFHKNTKHISEAELIAFNEWFSREFTKVPFDSRQDLLCRAKVLTKSGTSYSFKYPYVNYYFVAQHFANNLQDSSMRDRVKHLCKHIHVSEYANVLLFLSHHTRDPLVIDELMSIARSIFSDQAPLAFENDIKKINDLMTELPQVVYRASDPDDTRRKHLDAKDKRGDAADPLAHIDPKMEVEALNAPAKIILMFKVVEILGQIVRSYYGVLRKPQKLEMLRECHNGPMRSLTRLFGDVAEDPSVVIDWIYKNLHDERPTATDDQKLTFARRLTFWIFAYCADSFIARISDAVSSDNLLEEYDLLLKEDSGVGNRLLDISHRLNFPSAIPFSEIDKLAKDLDGNALAFRMLQGFVYRHLHMFRTSGKDKQRLCELLKIQMQTQRKIDLKTKNTKLLSKKEGKHLH